jgi:hypothetical protein
MIPLFKAYLAQIEITNACTHRCANCTRFVGHYRQNYFMDMETIERALDSLEGYRGDIGIMGGEPTLHPQFVEICELIQRKVPTYKMGLWTAGYKWDEYKPLICRTFKRGVYYNDHSDPFQKHQPVLVAIDEVIKDKPLMWKLIDKCWIQEKWSPSINPKGAFFCEVAAALDVLFEGPGGYPIEKGWWNKTVEQFQDQVRRYCPMCSGALPMSRPSNQEAKDLVSPGNLQRLLDVKSPKAIKGRVEVYTGDIEKELAQRSREWKPWRYLSSELKRKKNLKWDELWLIRGFHGIRRWYYRILGKLAGR